MKVPFLDLDAQYQSIKPQILAAIDSVLEKKDFIQGKRCQDFADHFVKLHGGNYGVPCANGTSAITVALRTLGIGAGDEVITQTNTFFATVEAIAEVGATPVLVDCNANTYGIDVEQVATKINSKTKAIIAVHLYGNAGNMEAVTTLAKKHKLLVLEDCAQAHMTKFDGVAAGAWGDASTFSFYPGKNLGAYGDAGLIIFKDEEQFKLGSMLVNHGRTKKYEHDYLAGNFRMDGLQAAILDVKLPHLDTWTKKRQEAAAYYDVAFKERGFKVIEKEAKGTCVYHLYVVEVSNRDEVMSSLKEKGIETGIHYPVPMHLQPAMSSLGHKQGDFPVAEKAAERIVSLPIFPEMTKEQMDYVIKSFFEVAKK